MTTVQSIAVIAFWLSLAGVFYAYVGYPVVIWCLARLFGRSARPPADDSELPTVSLLIAAYNEEAVIEERIKNALAMDYPKERMEVVVASDGSADRTGEIVRRYSDQCVRLLDFRPRRGKAACLNAAMDEICGEVVMLSDANTFWDPSAARKVARWFRDPAVGAVVGRLVLTDPATGRNADGLYWKYETFLKKCEGRLGALLGANGAIYAVRRKVYSPIPNNTIVDDFVIPLLAKLRTNCSIVYDPEAVADEETPAEVGSEFNRRTRIGAGGFQSLAWLWKLLDPRRGWISFTFFSHKIMRWLCPFFLIGMLAANTALSDQPLYFGLLLAQMAFYLVSVAVARMPAGTRLPKPLRLTTMFTGMNLALLVGFWRWLKGTQKAAWQRTARLAEANA